MPIFSMQKNTKKSNRKWQLTIAAIRDPIFSKLLKTMLVTEKGHLDQEGQNLQPSSSNDPTYLDEFPRK